MIDPKITDLQPDDLRVNPELHRLVREATKSAHLEEMASFNPMKRPVFAINDRLRQIRQEIIDDYLREHNKPE